MNKKDKSPENGLLDGDTDLGRIYRPGSKVEIVFDVDSEKPVVSPATLYEFDSAKKHAILSQTTPEILPSHAGRPTHLTKLVEGELNQKVRIGLDCRIKGFLDRYRLSSGKTDRALQVAFQPASIKVVNIRSAYRFEPNAVFQVESRIHCLDAVFVSGKDYLIKNISFSGIGLSVDQRRGSQQHPLMALKVGDAALIEIVLRGGAAGSSEERIECKLSVVRLEQPDGRGKGHIGACFQNLRIQDEEILSKFIHQAQLHQIRNIKTF